MVTEQKLQRMEEELVAAKRVLAAEKFSQSVCKIGPLFFLSLAYAR